MAALPLFLDLSGISCRVVGAGRVAERRIVALVRAGARVTVVAPRATRRVADLARNGRLVWRREGYRSGGLRGARLVVAATSDARVNRAIALQAGRLGLFCNVADDAKLCTMTVPAVLRRGPLQLAVFTGGESPALARRLRDDLARRYGPEYGTYLRILGSVRRRLLRSVGPGALRTQRYRRLLDAPVLRLLRAGRIAEARRAARCAAGLE